MKAVTKSHILYDSIHMTYSEWANLWRHNVDQRLLIFLPAILIPACASSSPAFCLISQVFCRMHLSWSSSALFLVTIWGLWSYPSLKGRPQRFSVLLIVSREYSIGTSGGPVVKTLYFHCRGHGLHPWSGN